MLSTGFEAIPWWAWVPLVYVIYRITSYVSYTIKYYKSGASAPPHYNDGVFGFWFTKETLRRRKTGEIPQLFIELYDKIKRDTFTFRATGTWRFCTRDPENIKAILGTQFNDFSLGLRHKQFRVVLGDGIFTLDGAGWKHSRAMLRPQFAREQVSHVTMLEPHVKQVIRRVKATNGSKFDLQPLFFKLTIDSGTQFLFGESCASLQDDIADYADLPGPEEMEHFPKAFNTSQTYLLMRMGLQNLYFLLNTKEFKECNKIVHHFADYYVNKALEATSEEVEKHADSGYVFLYELVKQTRDPKVLRDQCLNILVAARDTTAGLMSFLFFELSRNPAVFQKLRAEIVEAFGEGEDADLSKMTFESLKKLEYLKWVLNETLRLYPSVPQNSRLATRDTTLPRGGGKEGNDPVFVPKGSVVVYTIYATHRNPEIYGKDAGVWRPERWGEPDLKKVGWGFLPFNGGPRICLGQQFALTEASYVTVRLLQNFSNIGSFAEPGDPKKNTHLTMSLHGGTNIKLY
ncbi:hypothetical protein FT663_01956 [Candidozyma haemuli var. vulneris]|uniref:Uncharacterized protein n=1 Tax=Candidozyma haemuli TaxID=45357 RepID=A0A2V1AVZ7_9ASCO|nr:hypothetical protein CXQ85_000016 [[Candida] haemuloni]KAF3985831.1 hypothetical protein FT662_04913 [[Candida] haemuloni var. vulneris]KAF3993208.1 hypothetical protein FT663_01956 [[Candida] haemuloni var. vulneris]PVH21051.1 hypothetical protein CXQ85_000016 [[Candida] haemuloni]